MFSKLPSNGGAAGAPIAFVAACMLAIPAPIIADAPHAPYKNCRATRNGACASLRSFVSFEYFSCFFLSDPSSLSLLLDARGRTETRRAHRRDASGVVPARRFESVRAL
jgi:hypothetical protein